MRLAQVAVGEGLYLVIGGLTAVVLLAAVVLIGWAMLKSRLRKTMMRLVEQEIRRQRFRADGSPRPPVGRGLCDRCQQARDEVYHLGDGRRLCRECYGVECPDDAPAAPGAVE